jgi:hypothetical protein
MMGAEALLLDVLDDIHTWNTYVYLYGWLPLDYQILVVNWRVELTTKIW